MRGCARYREKGNPTHCRRRCNLHERCPRHARIHKAPTSAMAGEALHSLLVARALLSEGDYSRRDCLSFLFEIAGASGRQKNKERRVRNGRSANQRLSPLAFIDYSRVAVARAQPPASSSDIPNKQRTRSLQAAAVKSR